jgi:coenzyme Q-binding protein COQ10
VTLVILPVIAVMQIEKVGSLMPFTCAQVFDMAADIERYPEFMPWWISVSIVKRQDDTCDVEQVLGRGPVRVRFASRAVLQRPQRIDISSTDPQFRQLDLVLRVLPHAQAGCSLAITLTLQLQSAWLQQLVRALLARTMDEVVAAYQARAHQLYDGQLR